MMNALLATLLVSASVSASTADSTFSDALVVERVSTRVPFPRGLAVYDGRLYVLARGRVRDVGGVSADVDDMAGTIFSLDPHATEPVVPGERDVSETVRNNGVVFAAPTDPPFRLWDRTATPPEADRRTDRPYCTLRFHAATRSFYVCAFSGIDKADRPNEPGYASFAKNFTDALLRYDLRTGRWHEVERHDARALGRYPHDDPARTPPPHGLLKGPDNCLPLGQWLYAAAKDNSVLARYDLSAIEGDPNAAPPPGEIVFGEQIDVEGYGLRTYRGQSALAYDDGWLYVAYRTSSTIIRIRLDASFSPVRPIRAQLLAQFAAWKAPDWRSSNITDIDIDDRGRVYVCCARPARVYRFEPDPSHVFAPAAPWLDLANVTGNPALKSENILHHDGWLYVTSGDSYAYQAGADGAVYRVSVED